MRLPILLGRGEEAKFRIQHDLVSRKHCEFFERQGQVYVRDLGSTNGTFLNDEQVPVSTETVVPPGGLVRVGGLSFTVEYQPPTTADATSIAQGIVPPDGHGAEESRVEGNNASFPEEQPDFQVVHEDEESPEVPPVVALSEQASSDEATPADAAAADPDEVRFPEPAGEAAGEPAATPVSPSQQSEGFGFLTVESETTSSSDGSQWPAADAVPDVPDDEQLDSFFKGLK